MKILIVEDDMGTAHTMKDSLVADGHTVETAADGAEGLFLAKNFAYDAIILDYSLPKKDGLEVTEEIRAMGSTTPIIFVSTTMDVPIKVKALDAGADDYMTKPFSVDELRARIKALSRRPPTILKPVLTLEDLVLDSGKQIVHRGPYLIKLTNKEYALLEYMMRHIGIILPRTSILEHAWTAETDVLSNTVESHIRNLRKKLNIRNKANLILNVPGRGYIIDTPKNLKLLKVK